MLPPSSWRDLLKAIISNPREHERIATEIGVNPITLNRWASGESQPRPQNARQLLRAVPKEQQELLADLLKSEYGNLTTQEASDVPADEIDLTFIRQVFEVRATTPASLVFWTLCRKVLQNAVRRLDPLEIGLVITIAQCMPPSEQGKVRSLREIMGLGTGPWSGDLDQQFIFLGVESLAGYAVSTCHPQAIDDLRETTTLLPTYAVGEEVSAAAHPLLYANGIAGCLVVSCTQPKYFSSPDRLRLIADYADLITLAFTPEQFYALEQIELRVMPPYQEQRRQFATIQQRIVTLMKESFNQPYPLSHRQAELLVWRQLEEELLFRKYFTD
jgi:hypothetical protein